MTLALPKVLVAETIIKITNLEPFGSDEARSLALFVADVEMLTNGTLKFQITTNSQTISELKTLDAVSSGVIEAAFSYTHRWDEKYPELMLFGSPLVGASVGLDKSAFFSWLHYGGGLALYDQMWKQLGLDIKSFVIQSSGPRPMGWFKKPVNSLEKLRKNRVRTIAGQSSNLLREMGLTTVPLRAPDIIPELERNRISGVSWCCPKEDLKLGLHENMRYYYLQDVRSIVSNAAIYVNRQIFDSLTEAQKKAIETASLASIAKQTSHDISENGKALKELVEYHNVKIMKMPTEYFESFVNAAISMAERYANERALFSEILQSQKDFAVIAIPYWYEKQSTNLLAGRLFLKRIE